MFAMSPTLERAIQRFRRHPVDGVRVVERKRMSGMPFRAAVELRLQHLERDIGELKSKLNGLIFVVIGAVITQLVLKVVQ